MIVMHGSGRGGVEKSIATLCNHMDRQRFRVIVALPNQGPLKTYLDDIGVRTVLTPLEWWTPIWFFHGERHYYRLLGGLSQRVANLTKIINEDNISLVHSSTLTVADGAVAARLCGKPHVWHLHGRFDGSASSTFGTYVPIDVVYRIVDQLSHRIVTVSEMVQDFLSSYITRSKMQLIYNGIDTDQFNKKNPSSGSLFDEYPGLKEKTLVTLIGRIARVKGIEAYVEAAIEVLKQRDGLAFMVVGKEEDKDLGKKVRKRIDSVGFSDKIIFTGYRDDIPTLLQQVGLVVCSSLKEGFPYSCLEAMAASKPLVSTKCGGPNELVVHEETGYLVNVGKPAELASAILKVVDNPERMNAMGQKSRRRIEELFDARVYAQNFEKLYGDMLEEQHFHSHGDSVWETLIVNLLSDMGNLGSKVIECEREIEEVKKFQHLLRDNFVYRTVRQFYRFLTRS